MSTVIKGYANDNSAPDSGSSNVTVTTASNKTALDVNVQSITSDIDGLNQVNDGDTVDTDTYGNLMVASSGVPGTARVVRATALRDLHVNLRQATGVEIGVEGNRLKVDNVLKGDDSPDHTTVNVSTSSTTVLTADDSRIWFWVQNNSDTTIYLSLRSAATVNQGIRLNGRGSFFSMGTDNFIYRGAISAIHGGSGSKQLLVIDARSP